MLFRSIISNNLNSGYPPQIYSCTCSVLPSICKFKSPISTLCFSAMSLKKRGITFCISHCAYFSDISFFFVNYLLFKSL